MPTVSLSPASATPVEVPGDTRRKLSELFSRDEIALLSQRSDPMGFAAVGFTWGVIVATLSLLAWAAQQPLWLAAPLFGLGMLILGGRHLSLAILMHDAAHGTLFKRKWLNDQFADWLCARPIWNDLHKYRAHHFIHHTRTGQSDDSDLSLVSELPCSRASLLRKFARDLIGLTGLKLLYGRLLMDLGLLKWTVAKDIQRLPQDARRWYDYPRDLMRNMGPSVLVNGLLFGLCWLAGAAWLYGIWVLSYITPFPLFVRIRSLAEHACTETSQDMFRNTRTTRAGWLARMTVAPLRVNFHIEHHVMASVPYWRLPLMHRWLRERGALAAPPGYWQVLKLISSRP